MGSGINNKINEFLCKTKNVKKRRNTRLEKCYGQVNIASAFFLYCCHQQSVFFLSHFLTEGVVSHELNVRPIRLFIIRLATFSTVRRLLLPEYMIFIFENPLSASAELTAIALIILLAFSTLEGTSVFVRLL